MTTPSRSVRLLAFGASAVATIALLALVEFVAGFLVEPQHPLEIPEDAVSRTMTWLDINPAPQVRDVNLLWRNAPGARKTQPVNPRAYGRNDQWSLEINSEGFRGPERIAPAPGEKVFRVLCVGDSITFGFSVDQPDTYPQQLSDLLARRYPNRRFEIINAGVPGWTWLQGLRFLDLKAEELDPDVIVIGHGANDQFFASKITDEELFLRLSSPFDKLRQRIAVFAAETNVYRALNRNVPQRAEVTESRGCREQIIHTGACHRVSVEQITAAVREVEKLAADRAADLLVANTDFLKTASVRGVSRAVEIDDIPFVNLVEEFDRVTLMEAAGLATRLGLSKASDLPTRDPDSAPEAKRVVLRVHAPDSVSQYRVVGTGLFRPQFSFAEALYDDGTHGDERARDAVFSVTIDVPADIPWISYQFFMGDTLEFTPLPPLASQLGDRVLQTPESRIAPVVVFGRQSLMVERTHPNRDGHQLIAQLLADKIEEMPAFRRFVHGESNTSDRPKAATGG